jgi:RNase P/RNase MRP subunit p29
MRALILSLFIGLSVSVFAQQSVTIKGWVIDQNTQQPLEGVNIVGVNSSFISDAKGAFTIELPLTKIAYRFRITHLGYAEQEVIVDARRILTKCLDDSSCFLRPLVLMR